MIHSDFKIIVGICQQFNGFGAKNADGVSLFSLYLQEVAKLQKKSFNSNF